MLLKDFFKISKGLILQRWSANHFEGYPHNAGLLDWVNICPPTRTRITLSNPVRISNTIVGQLSINPKIIEVVHQPLRGLLWLELPA